MRFVRKIQLPIPGFAELVQEASSEGFVFLAAAEHEWTTGENRFSQPGEAFYAVFAEEQLVAVGGVNQDPYLHTPEIGRLRRIYVRAAWRRQGLGALLVSTMLADARQTFHTVRLRADNQTAARLYETFGFAPYTDPHATHILHFARRRAFVAAGIAAAMSCRRPMPFRPLPQLRRATWSLPRLKGKAAGPLSAKWYAWPCCSSSSPGQQLSRQPAAAWPRTPSSHPHPPLQPLA